MSRTEELRNKLRKTSFDPDLSHFNAVVEDFLAKEKSASAGSTQFMKNLYDDFKKECPVNTMLWLSEKLEDLFLSDSKQPSWPSEPDWCFLDDKPMIFLHQFVDCDGLNIFVFRYFVNIDLGKQAVYKILAQDEEGKVRLSGDIRG